MGIREGITGGVKGFVHERAIAACAARSDLEQRMARDAMGDAPASLGNLAMRKLYKTREEFVQGVEEFMTPDAELPALFDSRSHEIIKRVEQ